MLGVHGYGHLTVGAAATSAAARLFLRNTTEDRAALVYQFLTMKINYLSIGVGSHLLVPPRSTVQAYSFAAVL